MEYYSCEWIEERLILRSDVLLYCCIPHSNGKKGFVRVCDFKGGKLPMDEIRRAREKLTELNNRDDVDSPCKGCHYLKKKAWNRPKGNAHIRQVEVDNYSLCNLRCTYCFVSKFDGWQMQKCDYDLAPVFKDMIEQGYFTDDAVVGWGGGEPTILKDFHESATMLLEAGMKQRVFTNAVRFSEVLEAGLRQKKISIVTSIDAGTRETYDAIKGRDRYHVVWKNLARYARTGGHLVVKYIIRRGNSDPENIKQFVDKVEECGIRQIWISPDCVEIAQEAITEETIYAFALLTHEAERRGIPCCIGEEYLSPENRELVSKYIPLSEHQREYERYQRRERVRRLVREARFRARLFVHRFTSRRAVRRAQAQLAAGRAVGETITELMDRQTRKPNAYLRSRLTEALRSLDFSGKQVDGNVTVLGLSKDLWMVDGEPAYFLVDNERSDKPLVQELWLACWAKEPELPITVTVTDGIRNEERHTFYQAEQTRITVSVPAGQCGVFVAKTDRTWTPGNGDARTLGVRISNRQNNTV